MLGYFGIYSTDKSAWFRSGEAASKQRRSIFGILPHEIAALNAQQDGPAYRATIKNWLRARFEQRHTPASIESGHHPSKV
jgi:hypothetical protein